MTHKNHKNKHMHFPCLLFLLFTSFLTEISAVYANDIPGLRNGLVGYWPFCGNAQDKSGNNRNGTVNGAVLTKDRFGRDNSAYEFAGNNSSNITVGATGITGDYTLSFWEYTSVQQLACQIGMGVNPLNTGGVNSAYGIQMNGSAVVCGVAPLVRSVTDGASSCTNILSNTQPVQLNKWTHIIVSRKGSLVSIFVNGALVASGSNLTLVGITNLVFGMRSDATAPFRGILDDIALWNRALSSQEMQRLYVAVPTVKWSTGATSNKITVNPGQTTTYYVTVSDGITSCIDSVKVTIASVDTSVTVLDPTAICTPVTGTVRMQANAASGYQYQWLLNGTAIQGATARLYTATQVGQYRVVLTNASNCRDTSRIISVTLAQNPPVNIRYPDAGAVINTDQVLNARALNGAVYQWIPSLGLNNSGVQSPIFNYNRDQEYLIRIATAQGCNVTDTLLVRINPKRDIYVPDAFSPNFDGINDKLMPRLVGVPTILYFKVYNRWGHLMFETDKKNTGWDGTFRGVKQPMETYVWIAEGVDIDGNRVKRSGSTILIR